MLICYLRNEKGTGPSLLLQRFLRFSLQLLGTGQKWPYILGTLTCHDGDGDGDGDGDDNENVKKAIGSIGKTTSLHVHHAFLYISLPFLHNYDVK